MREKAKKRTRKIGFLRKRRINQKKRRKNGNNRSITTNQNINELQ